MIRKLFLFIPMAFLFQGCFLFYSFKGISVPAEANTFFVETFDENLNGIYSPPPTLFQDFTDALIDKVRNESSLSMAQIGEARDIEFKGTFTRYNVTYVAPKAGEEASFNRLEVSVSVEYNYAQDEESSWKQTFSFFEDFDIDANLLDIQEELLSNITEQLIEDIFNKAFTNW